MTHQTITLNAGDSITITTAGAPPIQPPVVEPPIVPPVVPPIHGYTNVIKLEQDWKNPRRIETPMGFNDLIICHFRTGSINSAPNNLPRISAADFRAPPWNRHACLSDKPNDFTQDFGSPYAIQYSPSPNVPFSIGPNPHGYPQLQPNTDYYFNIKNDDNAPIDRSYDMLVELSVPGDIR